jgi:hypothetical protein
VTDISNGALSSSPRVVPTQAIVTLTGKPATVKRSLARWFSLSARLPGCATPYITKSTVGIPPNTSSPRLRLKIGSLCPRLTLETRPYPGACITNSLRLCPSCRWGALQEILQFEVSGRCGSSGELTSVIRYVKMHVYVDYDMHFVLRNDVVFAWVLTAPAHAHSTPTSTPFCAHQPNSAEPARLC